MHNGIVFKIVTCKKPGTASAWYAEEPVRHDEIILFKFWFEDP